MILKALRGELPHAHAGIMLLTAMAIWRAARLGGCFINVLTTTKQPSSCASSSGSSCLLIEGLTYSHGKFCPISPQIAPSSPNLAGTMHEAGGSCRCRSECQAPLKRGGLFLVHLPPFPPPILLQKLSDSFPYVERQFPHCHISLAPVRLAVSLHSPPELPPGPRGARTA